MTEELINMVIDYQKYMEPYEEFPYEDEVRWTRDLLENDLDRFVFELRELMDECDPDEEVYVMTKRVLDAIIDECGATYDLDFPVTIYATVKIRAASQGDAMSIARGLWRNDDFLKRYVIPQYSLEDVSVCSVDEPDAQALVMGKPTMKYEEISRYL